MTQTNLLFVVRSLLWLQVVQWGEDGKQMRDLWPSRQETDVGTSALGEMRGWIEEAFERQNQLDIGMSQVQTCN